MKVCGTKCAPNIRTNKSNKAKIKLDTWQTSGDKTQIY